MNAPKLFASSVFVAIALWLVAYTWVPARHTLHREQGEVLQILPQANTWHEVVIQTASGVRITCRGRRGWPLLGPNLCPLEDFEGLLGRTVSVWHDQRQPYEVRDDQRVVLAYTAHRQAQGLAGALALAVLAMAALVWRRG